MDARIPNGIYQRQLRHRGCGEAALVMVYRSLGLACAPEDLQPLVTRPGADGIPCAQTHLLCHDALSRGFHAGIVQARLPWQTLQACLRSGVRVIVNHRPNRDSRSGHYSMVVAIDEDQLLLHDPQEGPCRRLLRNEFLRLWSPVLARCEITGHILVAIQAPAPTRSCSACGSLPPSVIDCATCGGTFTAPPGEALGCVERGCPNRLWECCFCPGCDARFGWEHRFPSRLLTAPPDSR